MGDKIVTDWNGKPIGKIVEDANGKKTITSWTGIPLGTSDKNGTRDWTGKPISQQDVPGIFFK
jgi:hypothetical protein